MGASNVYLMCHLHGCNREAILWIYGVGLTATGLGLAWDLWRRGRKAR